MFGALQGRSANSWDPAKPVSMRSAREGDGPKHDESETEWGVKMKQEVHNRLREHPKGTERRDLTHRIGTNQHAKTPRGDAGYIP